MAALILVTCVTYPNILGCLIMLTHAQEVLRKFREEDAGGRLVAAYTGSSPAAPEVLDFLKDALAVPIFEGYGSTETGPVRAQGAVYRAHQLDIMRFALWRSCTATMLPFRV